MGAQVCAQIAPGCIQVPQHRELLSYWASPKRVGMGREDFCYSYVVPPLEPSSDEDRERVPQYNEMPPQCFITEGKLTFYAYASMVKALHNGTLFPARVLQKYCQESWLGYDPHPDDKESDVEGRSSKTDS